MADRTHIQWTDSTWNPVTGCTRVSPGCENCYIELAPPFRIEGRRFTDLENTRWSGGRRHCRACNSDGLGLKGARNGNSKLTEALVIEARARRAAGEQVLALAADYGVAQSVMSRALTGVTWSHV